MTYGRTSKLIPTLTAAMATVWLTAACSDSKDQVAYCVNAQNEVVPQSYCDTTRYTGGVFPYYIWYGSPGRSLNRGNVVPNSGQRFSATDSSQRSSIGLSGSGSIAGSDGSSSGGLGTKIGKSGGGGGGGGDDGGHVGSHGGGS